MNSYKRFDWLLFCSYGYVKITKTTLFAQFNILFSKRVCKMSCGVCKEEVIAMSKIRQNKNELCKP